MNTLIITDTRASLGDLKGAMRGLWADITQNQGTSLSDNNIACFALPEAFNEHPRTSSQRLKLRYHKGSENMGKAYGIDCRLWDVLSPKLAGYVYTSISHIPTLSITGLKERGLIR